MSIVQWRKMVFIGAMLSCVGFSSSASSRLWKATPAQIAGDYGTINHNRGSGDFVAIIWFASPMATAGSQIATTFEKYVVIGVVHSHTNVNQPAAGIQGAEVSLTRFSD